MVLNDSGLTIELGFTIELNSLESLSRRPSHLSLPVYPRSRGVKDSIEHLCTSLTDHSDTSDTSTLKALWIRCWFPTLKNSLAA